MEKLLDVVNKNVQDALRKFQDTKNKELAEKQKNSEKTSPNIKVKQRIV
jgi:hypothetical protein